MPKPFWAYEVNCFLYPEAVAEFLIFLDAHVKQLLALNCFYSVDVYEPEEDCNCPAGAVTVTVVYKIRTREDLKHYFQNTAPEMKAHTIAKFGSKIVGSTHRIMMHNKHINKKTWCKTCSLFLLACFKCFIEAANSN